MTGSRRIRNGRLTEKSMVDFGLGFAECRFSIGLCQTGSGHVTSLAVAIGCLLISYQLMMTEHLTRGS
jgi:hypothetical protein